MWPAADTWDRHVEKPKGNSSMTRRTLPAASARTTSSTSIESRNRTARISAGVVLGPIPNRKTSPERMELEPRPPRSGGPISPSARMRSGVRRSRNLGVRGKVVEEGDLDRVAGCQAGPLPRARAEEASSPGWRVRPAGPDSADRPQEAEFLLEAISRPAGGQGEPGRGGCSIHRVTRDHAGCAERSSCLSCPWATGPSHPPWRAPPADPLEPLFLVSVTGPESLALCSLSGEYFTSVAIRSAIVALIETIGAFPQNSLELELEAELVEVGVATESRTLSRPYP